eukprot:531146_1
MGNDLSDTFGKKVWYTCPACKKEKWAYESFVGNECYNCMGLKQLADASNKEMEKKDPEFLARRQRFCTMSNGWALHPKSTYKYSNFKVLSDKLPNDMLTDELILKSLQNVSPNNINKYKNMMNSNKYNTIGKRCIFLWTLESNNIYHAINKALNNDLYYELQKWIPIIHGITSYVTTPTQQSYTTFRGSKIVGEQFAKWEIGEVYRMPQIVATSTASSVADRFIKHDNGFKVIYKINKGCCNAKSVDAFSACQGEEEILLSPYTAVKCIGKSQYDHTITVQVLNNKCQNENAESRYV